MDNFIDKNVQVGVHFIYNINNIDSNIINNHINLKQIFDNLISQFNLSTLNSVFHEFEPYGYTGLYLLSESHLSFHTWPEHNKICLDIFSCSKNINYDNIIEFLRKSFITNNIDMLKINR